MTRFLLVFLFLTAPVFAQPQSVFMLNGPHGQGSAVLVHKCTDRADKAGNCVSLAATAMHVLKAQDGVTLVPGPVYTGVFQNGMVSHRINYAIGDDAIDLALVWLQSPESVPVAELADTEKLLPIVDDKFESKPGDGLIASFWGYGTGKLRETKGRTSFRHGGRVQSDSILFSGQSGGGMFVDGKLVGIISGGMQWHANEGKPTVTWPARCADASRIKPLIIEALKALPAK